MTKADEAGKIFQEKSEPPALAGGQFRKNNQPQIYADDADKGIF